MAFELKSKREIYKGRWMDLWATDFIDRDGKSQVWEWVNKHNSVMIFPITVDGNVVLIKNFRVPVEKYVWEIPAGLWEEGKSGEQIAAEELLAETGYSADKFIPLPPWPDTAANINAFRHTYIAVNAKKVAEQHLEAGEDVSKIMEIPLNNLTDYCISLPPEETFLIDILGISEIVRTQKLLSRN